MQLVFSTFQNGIWLWHLPLFFQDYTLLLLNSKDVAPLVYHLFCFMQRFISEFIISGEILCRNKKLAHFKFTKLLPLQKSLMWQVDEWCSFLTECILKIIFLSSWQETSVFFYLKQSGVLFVYLKIHYVQLKLYLAYLIYFKSLS